MLTRHFVVRGRVQGVAYRASCRREAQRLGLAGSAVNLPDGAVRVLIRGPADLVEALHLWLWQGPPLARVDAVEELPATTEVVFARGFTIG
jgi:acylphosphatase